MEYRKQHFTTKEHITLLKKRGLLISDEERASRYLNTIGYYRLSAYFIPFEQSSNADNSRNHTFIAGTNFQQVLALYVFDRKLRLIVMEAIERIEVGIRARWANALSATTGDPHAFMHAKNFKDAWSHQTQLAKVSGNLKRSNEIYIKHYINSYSQPHLPPIWAIVETLTFGELSQWLKNTRNNKIKKQIAREVGLPSVEILQSVMSCISLIRNICAHHGRLWNRKIVKQLPKIKCISMLQNQHRTNEELNNKLFNYLIVIAHMMKMIQPSTTWFNRLSNHIESLPQEQQSAMGFPNDWQLITLFE